MLHLCINYVVCRENAKCLQKWILCNRKKTTIKLFWLLNARCLRARATFTDDGGVKPVCLWSAGCRWLRRHVRKTKLTQSHYRRGCAARVVRTYDEYDVGRWALPVQSTSTPTHASQLIHARSFFIPRPRMPDCLCSCLSIHSSRAFRLRSSPVSCRRPDSVDELLPAFDAFHCLSYVTSSLM